MRMVAFGINIILILAFAFSAVIDVVQCKNTGLDDTGEVQWKCETDLDEVGPDPSAYCGPILCPREESCSHTIFDSFCGSASDWASSMSIAKDTRIVQTGV
jgi:hypothetical protein